MIVRVASTLNVVATRPGPASGSLSGSLPGTSQPSSNATRCSISKRPVSLLTAPRPLRGLTLPGISMQRIMPDRWEQFKNILLCRW